jgi:hypothetical protein
MAGTKKKTTMAKIIRERKVRERRIDKEARKQARKLAAANPAEPAFDPSMVGEHDPEMVGEPDSSTVGEPDPATVSEPDPVTVGEQ